jgi:hypothetical protein
MCLVPFRHIDEIGSCCWPCSYWCFSVSVLISTGVLVISGILAVASAPITASFLAVLLLTASLPLPVPLALLTGLGLLGSVTGPGPDWIRIKSGQWIRDSESGPRRAKMTHKNRKKVKKFHVLKFWMFSFEG